MVGILEEIAAAQSPTAAGADVAGCKTMIRACLITVSLLVATANLSFAQEMPPAPRDAAQVSGPQPWATLSPAQQQLLQKYQAQWNSLPADRQQSLARGSQRWLSMTPEQRAGAQQRFNQWRAMPPDQRQALRQRWQQFNSLPPEEQQRVRQNFQRFREMPPERRNELRRQWHQMSPEQRRSVIQQHGSAPHGSPPHH